MRLIFMGTPEFAVPSLKRLIEGDDEIIAVITRPDIKKGRGMQLTISPVKQLALENGINILQSGSVKEPEIIKKIKCLQPDIIIVVAYGEILNKEFLSIPKKGCINVHASLLPKFRGSAPIQWAILNGEAETGVTIQYIKVKLDAGDMIMQRKIKIDPEDDHSSLYKKLSHLGADALLEGLDLIRDGKDAPVVQDEANVTYVRKITKEDGLINWEDSAVKINNRVRALSSWPGTYTFLSGLRLKIIRAEIICEKISDRKPGEIVIIDKAKVVVRCGEGAISIKDVQPEAKKTMKINEFISGYRIKTGMKFGSKK